MPIDDLRASLICLSRLLEEVAEIRWSSWARRSAAQLSEGSIGPEQVRRAFGGAGSLNDLVIHPANGHRVDLASAPSVNERLREITSRIYEQSTGR